MRAWFNKLNVSGKPSRWPKSKGCSLVDMQPRLLEPQPTWWVEVEDLLTVLTTSVEKSMRQRLELLVSCRTSTIIRMLSGVDRSRTARTSTGWRTLLALICQKVTTSRRKPKSLSEGNCYLSSTVLLYQLLVNQHQSLKCLMMSYKEKRKII